MRQRAQACIRRVSQAGVDLGTKPDGNRAKLWLAVSQPPEKRRRAALPGKVKRLIIEAGGSSNVGQLSFQRCPLVPLCPGVRDCVLHGGFPVRRGRSLKRPPFLHFGSLGVFEKCTGQSSHSAHPCSVPWSGSVAVIGVSPLLCLPGSSSLSFPCIKFQSLFPAKWGPAGTAAEVFSRSKTKSRARPPTFQVAIPKVVGGAPFETPLHMSRGKTPVPAVKSLLNARPRGAGPGVFHLTLLDPHGSGDSGQVYPSTSCCGGPPRLHGSG